MTTYLLDANVVIALTVAEHEHHPRALDWLETIESFAVSPVIEGALVRFLVRLGESASTAARIVRAVQSAVGYQFWADDQSYGTIDLDHVHGHRQVTDAYLLGLVRAHDSSRNPARLATLDEALARLSPEFIVLLPDRPRLATPAERESAKRLALLGGTDPDASSAPRHRGD